jgi:hypothetical protein
MYINNFIKVFDKPLFDNILPFLIIEKNHFIFVKWLKKHLTQNKFTGRTFYNLTKS